MDVSVQKSSNGNFVLRIESGYRTGQMVAKGNLKTTDIEFPVTFSTYESAIAWANEIGYNVI